MRDGEGHGALMGLVVTEAEWREAKCRTDEWCAALQLPNGWLELRPPKGQLEGQRVFEHINGRFVVGSIGQHDGTWWLHVSVSRRKYIPSYEDLADVKHVFVGDALQAVQIFPRRERYVNIMPYCLHLWASLAETGDGLPDFGAEGTI